MKINALLFVSNTHAQVFDRRLEDETLRLDGKWAEREVLDVNDDKDLEDAWKQVNDDRDLKVAWKEVCQIPVPPHDNAYAEENAKYALLQGVFHAIMRRAAPAGIFTLSNVEVPALNKLKPDATHTFQENVPQASSIIAVHEVESCVSATCDVVGKTRTPVPYVKMTESKQSNRKQRKSPRSANQAGSVTDPDHTFLPVWETYAKMEHAQRVGPIKHANHFKGGVGQALNYLFMLYSKVGDASGRFASASDVRRIVFIGGRYESSGWKAFYSKTYELWTGNDRDVSEGFRILFKLIHKYARMNMPKQSASASASSSSSASAAAM
jgi:hypothetical protein